MNTIDAIRSRRSVKHYDPQHEMTEEEIDQLMSLSLLSPTAFNIQNWRFLIVKDKALREEIKEVSWNQTQVTEASLLIILCADLNAYNNNPERYWRNAPDDVKEVLVPAIGAYYSGNNQTQRDEAMRSCGIAAQTIMLAAKAMNYDSCPMDGFDFDAVARLINLPDDYIISMFVVVGKGIQEPWPRPGQLPVEEIYTVDRFE
jgi:nitroreductase